MVADSQARGGGPDNGGKGWSFRRRLVACEVAVTLLCGGYIGLALEPLNRLFMFFNRWDTAALILLVAISGWVAATLLHAAAWVTGGRSDRWLSPGFFFWAVLVIFNFRPAFRLTLVEHVPWLTGTVYYLLIWAVGGLSTAAACRWPRWRATATAGWRYSVYLWPLLPILLFNLCAAPRWEDVSGSPADLGRHSEGTGAPVVVVVLDMIGYEDAFVEGGKVKEGLPHLAAFAEAATVFHRARSSGNETGHSLPGLLLQEEVDHMELGRGPARWRRAEAPGEAARPAAAFERALPHSFKRAGYRSVFVGFYLPYKDLMPGAFDEVFTRSYYGAAVDGRDVAPLRGALLHQAIRFVSESKDPVSAALKQFELLARFTKPYFRNMALAVHAEGDRYLRDALSPGDFAVLHLPIPHHPYVFDADGGWSPFGQLDPAGYPGQLQYADRLFGKWLAAIRDAGWWEASWVVVLSDHGPHHRDYRGLVDGKRHVPLLVKAPGQTVRRDVENPIRLADFEDIPGFPLPSPDPAGEKKRAAAGEE
jgi:hypothetical protein